MSKVVRFGVAFVLAAMLGEVAATSVYRCEQNGAVNYSGKPCGDGSDPVRIIEANPAGTGQVRPAPTRAPAPSTAPEADGAKTKAEPSPCRFFQSTNLRTYLIRGKVLPGMTRTDVIKAWGEPAESWREPVEMWTYEKKYHGRLTAVSRVYFRDGCVTSVESGSP